MQTVQMVQSFPAVGHLEGNEESRRKRDVELEERPIRKGVQWT